MSTQFNPLDIPPGVVALATKKMRSSNWSEVNAIRWIEGLLQPIGGQQRISYTFASRCRAIHPWFDLKGNYYVAYLCEQNVYVDVNGALIEITPVGGLAQPSSPPDGYGMGYYGMGAYGAPPRPGATMQNSLSVMPDVYSIDNFGALLLVMTSADERLLWWDPAAYLANTSTVLTQVTNAPPGRCFVVTSDRFVMIFGMVNDASGSARRFGWCDQEDLTDWDFSSVTNQAGFFDLEPASPIVTAIAGRAGWVVFFTEKKAYVSRFLGLPYVYDYEELADDCTPWSPMSIATTSSLIVWMSQQGAFSFDGTSVMPVQCPVRTWIVNDVDPFSTRWQAAACHVGMFSEFWWMFPQNGQPYNTRAVVYNYKEGWWSQMAAMPRSAGFTSTYASLPIFADGTQPYQHEIGAIYNACALPYADTFDLNLQSGGKLTTFKQMIPDIEGDTAGLEYQLFYRNSRSTGAPELASPPVNIRSDGYVDFRTTGRDMRLRFAVKGPQVNPFTLGQHLVDVVPRGDR